MLRYKCLSTRVDPWQIEFQPFIHSELNSYRQFSLKKCMPRLFWKPRARWLQIVRHSWVSLRIQTVFWRRASYLYWSLVNIQANDQNGPPSNVDPLACTIGGFGSIPIWICIPGIPCIPGIWRYKYFYLGKESLGTRQATQHDWPMVASTWSRSQ